MKKIKVHNMGLFLSFLFVFISCAPDFIQDEFPRWMQSGEYRNRKEIELEMRKQQIRKKQNTTKKDYGEGQIYPPGSIFVTPKGYQWEKLPNNSWEFTGYSPIEEKYIKEIDPRVDDTQIYIWARDSNKKVIIRDIRDLE